MLSLTPEDMVALALLWLVCGFLSAVLFIRWAVLRWAGKAVVDALCDPTEETKAAVGSLLGLIISSEVQTGKTITVEGKEFPESVPFLRFLGREVWQYLGQVGKASTGGMTTKALGEMGLGAIGPRKGQSSLEFILEQSMIRLGPKLDEIVSKKVEDLVNSGR